jgi:hypothetical protein
MYLRQVPFPYASHHAALVLELCARCARYRIAPVAGDDRKRPDLLRCQQPAWAPRLGIRGLASPAVVAWGAVTRWAVDADRRSSCRSREYLGDRFSFGGLASICLDCGHGRGPRSARTRCVVHRCLALWMEANKNTRSETKPGRFGLMLAAPCRGPWRRTDPYCPPK